MSKDFDSWNKLQKFIESKNVDIFCNTREIWWASLGLNIGSEEDGKNNLFERPVLIIKVFNKSTVRILPLTSKTKNDKNHVPISYEGMLGSVILSQLKTISTKRLTRKLCKLNKREFDEITQRLRQNLL